MFVPASNWEAYTTTNTTGGCTTWISIASLRVRILLIKPPLSSTMPLGVWKIGSTALGALPINSPVQRYRDPNFYLLPIIEIIKFQAAA